MCRLGAGVYGSGDVQADVFWEPLSFERLYSREYQADWIPCDPFPEEAYAATDGSATHGSGHGAIEGGVGATFNDSGGGGDGSDGDCDVDSDDEWHLYLPGSAGGAGGGAFGDLFTGFTFQRENTMLGPTQRDGTLTRSGRLERKKQLASKGVGTPVGLHASPLDARLVECDTGVPRTGTTHSLGSPAFDVTGEDGRPTTYADFFADVLGPGPRSTPPKTYSANTRADLAPHTA